MLPKLKEISENGGAIDVIVVTHIDADHISGIIKLLEEEVLPISIGEIWYNGYRHIQSVVKVSANGEHFVHDNICKAVQLAESKKLVLGRDVRCQH